MRYMSDSGLPQASSRQVNMRIGNIPIRTSQPKESITEAREALKTLEKAAQDKVFISNEDSE